MAMNPQIAEDFVWEEARNLCMTPFELRRTQVQAQYDDGKIGDEDYARLMEWIDTSEKMYCLDMELLGGLIGIDLLDEAE
jgi:hypothetical protein